MKIGEKYFRRDLHDNCTDFAIINSVNTYMVDFTIEYSNPQRSNRVEWPKSFFYKDWAICTPLMEALL